MKNRLVRGDDVLEGLRKTAQLISSVGATSWIESCNSDRDRRKDLLIPSVRIIFQSGVTFTMFPFEEIERPDFTKGLFSPNYSPVILSKLALLQNATDCERAPRLILASGVERTEMENFLTKNVECKKGKWEIS
ncbi:hypothetical protein GEV33_013052 [Tenebrio molitor]|uniref:Uncharacterized protein n=1 Tax=Tenebrio molitor TaxID=7067 RepID=A0A8J6H0Y5_TENMO|nr:hypothetical protein GEV33_013052 [Tenebrio molitor]